MGSKTSPVIIIGAGPTGLSLALLLARAGIPSVLCERNSTPQAHPAACILDTRTMEIFREIGVAETILTQSQDVMERARITWVTSLSDRELGSCSVLPDDVESLLALSPVHATSLPQNRLEPILWQKVAATPLITFLPGHECVGMREEGHGVVVSLKQSGTEFELSGAYAVVCEGASGKLRTMLGIAADGRALQHMIGIYFESDLTRLVEGRKSILYWVLNPDVLGVLIAHWLPTEWVLFAPYFPPQQSAEEFDEARCRSLVEGAVGFRRGSVDPAGAPLGAVGKSGAALPARDEVFLAGDAAHSFPPTGGLGLNTGMQDAHNLAWKIAAVVSERAGEGLLDTYEAERRPVARTNLDHSVANYERMSELTGIAGLHFRRLRLLQAIQTAAPFRMLPLAWQRRLLAAVLRQAFGRLAVFTRADDGGGAARAAFTRAIGGQVKHYRFVGLDLGFTYEAGAFVPDGSPKPLAEDPVIDYRPTTWPSARLPHFRVEQGGLSRSIHDFVEADRFLLLTDELGAQPWWEAIAALDERPARLLRCLVVGPGADADLRDHGAWRSLSEVEPGGAVLVRPDGHVGWRARSLPDAPAAALKAALLEILRLA